MVGYAALIKNENTTSGNNLIDEEFLYLEADHDDDQFQTDLAQSSFFPFLGDCCGLWLNPTTRGKQVTVLRRDEVLAVSSESSWSVRYKTCIQLTKWLKHWWYIFCCPFIWLLLFAIPKRVKKKDKSEEHAAATTMYVSAKRYNRDFEVPVRGDKIIEVASAILNHKKHRYQPSEPRKVDNDKKDLLDPPTPRTIVETTGESGCEECEEMSVSDDPVDSMEKGVHLAVGGSEIEGSHAASCSSGETSRKTNAMQASIDKCDETEGSHSGGAPNSMTNVVVGEMEPSDQMDGTEMCEEETNSQRSFSADV